MKKVMVFGSFDHIHPGHMHFLKQAKSHGDWLVAVIALDDTIKNTKGRPPKYGETQRAAHVANTGIPDEVLLGNIDDKYAIIEKVRPEVICLGYDQEKFTVGLKEKLSKRGVNVKIVKLEPYKEHIFKSSIIKKEG